MKNTTPLKKDRISAKITPDKKDNTRPTHAKKLSK